MVDYDYEEDPNIKGLTTIPINWDKVSPTTNNTKNPNSSSSDTRIDTDNSENTKNVNNNSKIAETKEYFKGVFDRTAINSKIAETKAYLKGNLDRIARKSAYRAIGIDIDSERYKYLYAVDIFSIDTFNFMNPFVSNFNSPFVSFVYYRKVDTETYNMNNKYPHIYQDIMLHNLKSSNTPLNNIANIENGDPTNLYTDQYKPADILKINENADNNNKSDTLHAKYIFRKDVAGKIVEFTELGKLIKINNEKEEKKLKYTFQKMNGAELTDDFPLEKLAKEEAKKLRDDMSGKTKYERDKDADEQKFKDKQKKLIIPLVDRLPEIINWLNVFARDRLPQIKSHLQNSRIYELNQIKKHLNDFINNLDKEFKKFEEKKIKVIQNIILKGDNMTDGDVDYVYTEIKSIMDKIFNGDEHPSHQIDIPSIRLSIYTLYKYDIIKNDMIKNPEYNNFDKLFNDYNNYRNHVNEEFVRKRDAKARIKEFDEKPLSYFYPKKYILYVRIVPRLPSLSSLTRNKAPQATQGGKRSTRNRRKTQKHRNPLHNTRIRRRPVNIATSTRSSHRGTRKHHTHKK
jgi:hypothetical protein